MMPLLDADGACADQLAALDPTLAEDEWATAFHAVDDCFLQLTGSD